MSEASLLIIDGSYFYKACRSSQALRGRRVDYARLVRALARHVGAEFTHMYWIDSERADDAHNHAHQAHLRVRGSACACAARSSALCAPSRRRKEKKRKTKTGRIFVPFSRNGRRLTRRAAAQQLPNPHGNAAGEDDASGGACGARTCRARRSRAASAAIASATACTRRRDRRWCAKCRPASTWRLPPKS